MNNVDMTDIDVTDVDLTDHQLYRHGVPHAVFDGLRASGPVHRHRPVRFFDLEPMHFWSVVRHAEIQQANRDWESFSAVDGVTIHRDAPERRGRLLVTKDPPDHTRMRRLITAGFTPRMIGRLEDHIAARTAAILDAAAAQSACDFVSDIAYQLPMHVIADIVGIPEDDRPWVFERVEHLLRGDDPLSDISAEQAQQSRLDVFGYAQRLTEEKRSNPADDVWTLIAQAELEGDDGTVHRLEGIELEMFFIILALAGSETTRNAISQGMLTLLDHPDQLAELRADPGLLPSATEELIRWASPVLFFGRTATRDVELGGQRIPAGDRVVLWYPSGNRDDRAFADPYRFDIHRDPNPHVSFGGGGPHFCLGANLAKKEVQVMIGALVDRFDVQVLGEAVWGGAGAINNVGVSIDRLPVRLVDRR